ncbi:MAG: hypothetical protein EBR58_03525 [Betaproteobacteria bacterium]|nr:hypothetical protein [Betaproteobacteria bacterium]
MTSIFQICSPVWLRRGVRATVVAMACAVAAPALVLAQGVTATLDNAASTERLISEFGGWIGNRHDADQLVTTLRSGRPTATEDQLVTTLRSGRPTATEGAASKEPATGPLGYGEVRLALKLAQGALAQQGVAYPNPDQLQAALHGGVLRTPQGEQVMDGVLPQKARGTGWANMAERYGLTMEDLLPPPGKAVTVKSAKQSAAKGKAKAGAKGKASAKASSNGKAKASAKKPVAKAAKPAAKVVKKATSGK